MGITLAHHRFVPPPSSDFGTIVGTNSENPTLTDDTHAGLVFSFGSSPATGDNLRAAMKAKPSSTDYDIIARLLPTPTGFDYYDFGILVSDGTKYVMFGATNGPDNGYRFSVDKWNTTTSFSASALASTLSPGREVCEWFKVSIVASVPQRLSVSNNGKDWVRIYDTSLSAFLTYTQIGFGMLVNRNAFLLPVASTPQAFMSVMYWSDPDISPPV